MKRPPNGTASIVIARALPDQWIDSGPWTKQDAGYSTPCWIWTRSLTSSGYAQVALRVAGRQYTSGAHRVLWEKIHGAVPPGKMLDHLCRNRPCVNPDHLEVVSHGENVRRGIAPRTNRRLTDEQVALIRDSRESLRSLARRFGVLYTAVRLARTGATYGHALWGPGQRDGETP